MRHPISIIQPNVSSKLRGILSAEEIRTPNNKDHKGDPMRYVIKRGLTTLTTIGCLTGFESHVRRYFALGSRDSVEAAVYPMTMTLVRSPGAGTLGPSSSMPSASSLPSSPVARDQPIPLTSRLVRQCTGSGRSSRPSSPVPTSTSKMTTTRFVSSFCAHPLVLLTDNLNVKTLTRCLASFVFYSPFPILLVILQPILIFWRPVITNPENK
jgi:hypothetical protein